MIVLDENVIENQAQLLRSWRVPIRQIGRDVGRQGMQDDELIPLFHSLSRVTFFSRDLRFYTREIPHANYCLVVLAVEQQETAFFVRRFLKHPNFNAAQKRMGLIVQAGHSGLRVRTLNQPGDVTISWLKLV